MTLCLPHRWRILAGALLAGLCSSCLSGRDVVGLQGSGATFPAPIYQRWFLEYYKQHPDVQVDYQPIGSGAGIRQFTEGLTDFGASDAAMSAAEREAAQKALGTEVILLPMTAGSVALCYNVPDGPAQLRLSRKAYVGIFLGDISSWDDPAIQACNEGAALPALPITVVRRADSSGTTFVFTNHLSALSPDWKKGPGSGKSITWPEAAQYVAAKGNDGVAATIDQTPGAIGYVETGYAELKKLPMATLENRSGNYVPPGAENSKEALREARLDKHLIAWVTDPAGANAYPIVTFTWLLCKGTYGDEKTAKTLREVLRYCLTEGQKIAPDVGYIPLPEEVGRRALEQVERIGPAAPEERLARPGPERQ